jgi:hypothetical protein
LPFPTNHSILVTEDRSAGAFPALLFAAAAAAGFRIQAITRDEPPEPPLAHRWTAMGGDDVRSS